MKQRFSFGNVEMGLLLVSVLWGLNMPAMKYGMGHMPPLAFNWLRFALINSRSQVNALRRACRY